MSTRTVDDILATFVKAERYERTNPQRAADIIANAYQRLERNIGRMEAGRIWQQACAAYDARTIQRLSA